MPSGSSIWVTFSSPVFKTWRLLNRSVGVLAVLATLLVQFWVAVSMHVGFRLCCFSVRVVASAPKFQSVAMDRVMRHFAARNKTLQNR